jgi:hypothetical protein
MPVYSSVIPQQLFIDPIAQYGCAFDHRATFDGACNVSTSTTTINSATAAFTNQDLNKRITLAGAGASGAMYIGSITAIQSATAVTVTPALTTTVTTKGLQLHTDDLTSWTNLITDLNNSVYPGAIIQMREAWTATGFTNRSGISSFLPTINKQIQFFGIAGSGNADSGDYTKTGGTCIAYVGSSSAPTAFGAVMTIAPVSGATNQSIKQCSISHMWIDCRNGDQNEALKGLSVQSCFGMTIEDFFVMDPLAVGMEEVVIVPGTAGALGEAKDTSRGVRRNIRFRLLDGPQATAMTTPVAVGSAITLSTSTQSLTVAANTLPTAGYGWTISSGGALVLINWTGGGGTTTLTGVTVSATDAQYSYITVSGANIVQAAVSNGCAIHLDGDATANSNLSHWDTVVISHSSTLWGPAAVEFSNSDSHLFQNLVINGGNNTVFATNPLINRITKPGVRLNGHTSTSFHARNNQFDGGSPGAGGCSTMSLNSSGAILAFPAGPNYWDLQQFGNAEPIPTCEFVATSATQGPARGFFDWTPNGGFRTGIVGPVSIATQTITGATTALVLGTLVSIPTQGFQVGTVFKWTIPWSKTGAGVATRTLAIKYGAAGSTSDATTIATANFTPTAVIDQGVVYIEMVITALGSGTSATALCQMDIHHTSATAVGWGASAITATMAGFNSTLPNSGPAFMHCDWTVGTSEVITILAPVHIMCLHPGNP